MARIDCGNRGIGDWGGLEIAGVGEVGVDTVVGDRLLDVGDVGRAVRGESAEHADDDVARVAAATGRPVKAVLAAAIARVQEEAWT